MPRRRRPPQGRRSRPGLREPRRAGPADAQRRRRAPPGLLRRLDGRDHRDPAGPPRASGGAGVRPGPRADRAPRPGHRRARLLLGLLLHLVPAVVPRWDRGGLRARSGAPRRRPPDRSDQRRRHPVRAGRRRGVGRRDPRAPVVEPPRHRPPRPGAQRPDPGRRPRPGPHRRPAPRHPGVGAGGARVVPGADRRRAHPLRRRVDAPPHDLRRPPDPPALHRPRPRPGRPRHRRAHRAGELLRRRPAGGLLRRRRRGLPHRAQPGPHHRGPVPVRRAGARALPPRLRGAPAPGRPEPEPRRQHCQNESGVVSGWPGPPARLGGDGTHPRHRRDRRQRAPEAP